MTENASLALTYGEFVLVSRSVGLRHTEYLVRSTDRALPYVFRKKETEYKSKVPYYM
jgi:hypothetical protein